MPVTLPTDLKFGYVAGQYLLAYADTTADTDRNPDGVPAQGVVTFDPLAPTTATATPKMGVIAMPITGQLDANGVLTDPAGAAGVWLMVGAYTVTFQLEGVKIKPFTITVTTANTQAAPLYLSDAAPLPVTPALKWVVNEQVYTDTLAARDAAVASKITATSIDGSGNLIITRGDGSTVNVGKVKGEPGDVAPYGASTTGTATFNMSEATTARTRRVTLTGTTTLQLPTPTAGTSFTYTLIFVQDATGGRAPIWPTNVKWPAGVKPTLSTAANAIDVVHFFWSGAEWLGFVGGQAFA